MMSSHYESLYWMSNKDWYYCDKKGEPHVKDEAPERAKKSFERWKSPIKPH